MRILLKDELDTFNLKVFEIKQQKKNPAWMFKSRICTVIINSAFRQAARRDEGAGRGD